MNGFVKATPTRSWFGSFLVGCVFCRFTKLSHVQYITLLAEGGGGEAGLESPSENANGLRRTGTT